MVISDAHAGVKAAIAAVMIGSSLATVSDGPARRRPRPRPARRHRHHARRQFPKVEAMLREAADDFPVAHWKKIWPTIPLEQVNKEIKRRTDVVGDFPNPAALLRLAGSVLVRVHDEWQVSERRYPSEGSMSLIDALGANDSTPAITEEVATAEPIAS
jgi:transposase-like protein